MSVGVSLGTKLQRRLEPNFQFAKRDERVVDHIPEPEREPPRDPPRVPPLDRPAPPPRARLELLPPPERFRVELLPERMLLPPPLLARVPPLLLLPPDLLRLLPPLRPLVDPPRFAAMTQSPSPHDVAGRGCVPGREHSLAVPGHPAARAGELFRRCNGRAPWRRAVHASANPCRQAREKARACMPQ